MKIKLNVKNVLVLSILAIIITSISLFFINTSLAVNTAKVVVETANLRETADSDSKILDLVNKGESVEILEKSGEWYKVKYKNITGYLRNDLLQLNKSTQDSIANTNTASTNTVNESKTENLTDMNTENTNSSVVTNTSNDNTAQNAAETSNVKYKAKEDLKLKVIPLIHALELSDVAKGTELEVEDVMNYWAYVSVQDKKGWVVLEKLEKVENNTQTTNQDDKNASEQKTSDEKQQIQSDVKDNSAQSDSKQNSTSTEKQISKTMYVNSQTVNMRKNADKNSELVIQLVINTKVEVVAEKDGWSKVNVNGKQGYILSTLLSSKKQETSRGSEQSRTATASSNNSNNISTTNSNKNANASSSATNQSVSTQNSQNNVKPSTGTASGAGVVEYAKQFIGVKYVYGGSSPSTGFDCSGFTSYVYKHFGITLPRTSGGQSGVGTAVSRANLQAGDLVIYSGHVAIYVGGGNVIHAPRPGKSVSIVPLDYAGRGFSGGRRVIK